jgi:hypothetical protein
MIPKVADFLIMLTTGNLETFSKTEIYKGHSEENPLYTSVFENVSVSGGLFLSILTKLHTIGVCLRQKLSKTNMIKYTMNHRESV